MNTFGTFLIALFCCVNNSFGQNNVTIRQVYDFEIGDVFYYKYERCPPPYNNVIDSYNPLISRQAVVDKVVSENNDTILS